MGLILNSLLLRGNDNDDDYTAPPGARRAGRPIARAAPPRLNQGTALAVPFGAQTSSGFSYPLLVSFGQQ
jgi:hypothetical protein